MSVFHFYEYLLDRFLQKDPAVFAIAQSIAHSAFVLLFAGMHQLKNDSLQKENGVTSKEDYCS